MGDALSMPFFIDGRVRLLKSFLAKRDQHSASWSFQSSPKIKQHDHHKTHLHTTEVYIAPKSKFCSFKILLFFNHWSIHLFQNNQRFQAIEFEDQPFPEKLYIFRITFHCMASVTLRYLSPVSTVFASNAWHYDARFGAPTRRKKKRNTAKASETNFIACRRLSLLTN